MFHTNFLTAVLLHPLSVFHPLFHSLPLSCFFHVFPKLNLNLWKQFFSYIVLDNIKYSLCSTLYYYIICKFFVTQFSHQNTFGDKSLTPDLHQVCVRSGTALLGEFTLDVFLVRQSARLLERGPAVIKFTQDSVI